MVESLLKKLNIKVLDTWKVRGMYDKREHYYFYFKIKRHKYCASYSGTSFIFSKMVKGNPQYIYVGYSIEELEKAITNEIQKV